MTKQLYKDLEVDEKATKAKIKRSYKKKAQQLHPDKKDGDIDKFKQIAHTYKVLANDDSRKRYDESGDESEFIDNNNRIYTFLSQIILEVIQSNRTGDLIKACESTIKTNLINLINNRTQLQNQKRKFDKKIGRVINDEDNEINLFENLILQQQKLMEHKIEEIDKAEDEFNQMLEMLKHYTDIKPDIIHPYEQGQSFVTGFSTGGGGFV